MRIKNELNNFSKGHLVLFININIQIIYYIIYYWSISKKEQETKSSALVDRCKRKCI